MSLCILCEHACCKCKQQLHTLYIDYICSLYSKTFSYFLKTKRAFWLSNMDNLLCCMWIHYIGIEGKRDDVFKSDNKFRESANKQKVTQLLWTPFLQQKFLQALELLGEGRVVSICVVLTTSGFQTDCGLSMNVNFISAATPKMIHLIMNVNSIDRTQVSAHLQVYAHCSY